MPSWKPRIVIALAALTALMLPSGSPAHEIPNDITIQAFVRPEGRLLRVLLRVPLRAMRDMEFPLRGPGYLEIGQADSELRNAAMLWIGNEMQLFEGDTNLGRPEIIAVRASIPSNRAFRSYDEALAHVTGQRLPDETELYWEQALLDVS